MLAIVVAVLAGSAVGLLHGVMHTRLCMPSFVVTLAGLIGWQGLLIYLLGQGGTINLPFDGFIAGLSDTWLPPWLAWLLVAVLVGAYAAAGVITRRLRVAAGLPVKPSHWIALRIGGLAVLLAGAVVVLSADRGVPPAARHLRGTGDRPGPGAAAHRVRTLDVRRGRQRRGGPQGGHQRDEDPGARLRAVLHAGGLRRNPALPAGWPR